MTIPKTHKARVRESPEAPAELLLQLRLESNPEALCLVRATIQRAAEILHFPEHECRAIVRSVDEALANVIRHAYAGREGMPIEVRCSRLRGQDAKTVKGLELVLSDSGQPAKPDKLKGRALDEIRPGGLGLHFIRQSMDVVEFRRTNGKNRLRLVKYLVSPRSEAALEGE